MSVREIRTRRIALAAYALANGGELKGYERGEFIVASPWPVGELVARYAASPEHRFDDHIIRLRDLKRSQNQEK